MANTYPEGAGGGTDDTDTSTDDTSSGTTDPRAWVNNNYNNWSLAEIQTVVWGVLRAVFPSGFLKDPRTWVIGTTFGWMVDTFVFPVFNAIRNAGRAMITAVIVVFLGTDMTLAPRGNLGLADLPLYLSTEVINAVRPTGFSILGFIAEWNQAIAQLASGAGIGAPAIVSGLYMIEIATVLYVAWSVVQLVDVPIIELSGLLRVVALPFKKILGVFR